MYGCVRCDKWWSEDDKGKQDARLHQNILNHLIVKEIRLD